MTGIAPGPRSPAPYEVARAKVRSQERVARLVARAQVVLPRKPEIDSEPEQEDDEDEARWSPERRAEETARAESRKLGGELPIPSSSWEV
jgi:hypothetical protein